jgi:hypothetical protein
MCAWKGLERMHPAKVDYISELREWVQHVISEAEKNNDTEKRLQFSKLLREL